MLLQPTLSILITRESMLFHHCLSILVITACVMNVRAAFLDV